MTWKQEPGGKRAHDVPLHQLYQAQPIARCGYRLSILALDPDLDAPRCKRCLAALLNL